MKIKTQAQYLQVGDRLRGGVEVVGVFNNGLKIPKGKTEVCVRQKNGVITTSYWNKQTTTMVERDD
jgi:hypothetical protein